VANSKTGILVILDGFGINPDPKHNAIAEANTPNWDRLLEQYLHGRLDASESHVGLPQGFMGNSEVGHLNIGAGRVVYQDFSLISRAIEEGTFYQNKAFINLFSEIKKKDRVLHLIGLVSDGGVHSHISHLLALIQCAKRNSITKMAIHAITDGRDTSPTSGVEYVTRLSSFCEDAGVGAIATVMGRFFAMDRDSRWDRTEKAYHAVVMADAEQSFNAPVAYLRKNYEENVTDEFIPPAVSKDYRGIENGDGVVFFNFRADRARQLTRAITQNEFNHFRRTERPELGGFVSMTPYDGTFQLASAFEKPRIRNTLGEVISQKGWKQLRIAETEKYAHVTYFFNGGDEKVFEGEKRILIPSPRDVKTYDLKPEMSASEVTKILLSELKTGEYRFAAVNFANPDMVGHTGNFRAAVKAVEFVDDCLGKIVDWVESNDAFAVVTSDHGNCELMEDARGMPLTSHTVLPVPIVIVDKEHKKSSLAKEGRLCDIAPTLLALWDIRPPKEMTGKSLI